MIYVALMIYGERELRGPLTRQQWSDLENYYRTRFEVLYIIRVTRYTWEAP